MAFEFIEYLNTSTSERPRASLVTPHPDFERYELDCRNSLLKKLLPTDLPTQTWKLIPHISHGRHEPLLRPFTTQEEEESRGPGHDAEPPEQQDDEPSDEASSVAEQLDDEPFVEVDNDDDDEERAAEEEVL